MKTKINNNYVYICGGDEQNDYILYELYIDYDIKTVASNGGFDIKFNINKCEGVIDIYADSDSSQSIPSGGIVDIQVDDNMLVFFEDKSQGLSNNTFFMAILNVNIEINGDIATINEVTLSIE